MRCSKSQKIWHSSTVRSQIWKRTERCGIILMNFLFFSLSFLCQSLPHFFFSNTDHSSLILSYFLLSPSVLFHVDVDHQFHANTDADTSLPRRSLSSCGFFFFFWVVVYGWVGMGRLVVGGFGWADRRPPRNAIHLRSSWLFIYFLVDVGWVSWVVMGWCWWVMAAGVGWFWVLVDFRF